MELLLLDRPHALAVRDQGVCIISTVHEYVLEQGDRHFSQIFVIVAQVALNLLEESPVVDFFNCCISFECLDESVHGKA